MELFIEQLLLDF